jgi:hypothetical protein
MRIRIMQWKYSPYAQGECPLLLAFEGGNYHHWRHQPIGNGNNEKETRKVEVVVRMGGRNPVDVDGV